MTSSPENQAAPTPQPAAQQPAPAPVIAPARVQLLEQLLQGNPVALLMVLLLGLTGGGGLSTLFGSHDGAKVTIEAKTAILEKLGEVASDVRDLRKRMDAIEAAQRELSTRGWTRDDHDRYAREAERRFEQLDKRISDVERERSK